MQEHHTTPQADSSLIAEHLANNTFKLERSAHEPKVAAVAVPTGDEALGMGGGGMHPAVTKHLRDKTPGMGGGGMHPALARHLQA